VDEREVGERVTAVGNSRVEELLPSQYKMTPCDGPHYKQIYKTRTICESEV
jgi:hypothetical protein